MKGRTWCRASRSSISCRRLEEKRYDVEERCIEGRRDISSSTTDLPQRSPSLVLVSPLNTPQHSTVRTPVSITSFGVVHKALLLLILLSVQPTLRSDITTVIEWSLRTLTRLGIPQSPLLRGTPPADLPPTTSSFCSTTSMSIPIETRRGFQPQAKSLASTTVIACATLSALDLCRWRPGCRAIALSLCLLYPHYTGGYRNPR